MASTDNSPMFFTAQANPVRNANGFPMIPPLWYSLPIQSESLMFTPNFVTPEEMTPYRSQMTALTIGGDVAGDFTTTFRPDPGIHRLFEGVLGNRVGQNAVDGGAPSNLPDLLYVGRSLCPIGFERQVVYDNGVVWYQRIWNAVMSGFSIEANANELATITWSVSSGRWRRTLEDYRWPENAIIPRSVYDRTPARAPFRMDASRVEMWSAAGPTLLPEYCLTTLNINVENGNEPRYCIGTKGPAGSRLGTFGVTVEFEAYLSAQSKFLVDALDANTKLRMVVRFVNDDNEQIIFRFNSLILSEAATVLNGPGESIVAACSATGLYNIYDHGPFSVYRVRH